MRGFCSLRFAGLGDSRRVSVDTGSSVLGLNIKPGGDDG
jgi:hypothetical protein